MTATQPATGPGRAGRCDTDGPVHDARDLVGEDGTAEILLDNQRYRLRITRAGKLILTK